MVVWSPERVVGFKLIAAAMSSKAFYILIMQSTLMMAAKHNVNAAYLKEQIFSFHPQDASFKWLLEAPYAGVNPMNLFYALWSVVVSRGDRRGSEDVDQQGEVQKLLQDRQLHPVLHGRHR